MGSPRIAVVTGASSGIGAATARALAGEGFRVVCAARRLDRVEALAAEIGGLAVACDVTDADSVAGLASAAGDVVHVLVNNAGGAFGADPVESADPADWSAMYDVNVLGAVRVTQALLPALRASGDARHRERRLDGRADGVRDAAAATPPRSTARRSLTETLRLELNGEPIRISEIAPGMVRTDEFSLVRFGGDQATRRRRVRRRTRSARGRGRRGRDRLDRDPAQPRQHRRAGDPAAGAGLPAQGPPRHLRTRGGGPRPTGQTSRVQTIGLVGGMSWESSAAYYKNLNLGVEQRLGGLHSVRIVMASVEFAEVNALRRRSAGTRSPRSWPRPLAGHEARRRRLPDALHHDVPPGRRPGRGRAGHPAAAPRRRGRRGLQGPAPGVRGLRSARRSR